MKEPLTGIIVFSAVETVATIGWGAILGLGHNVSPLVQVLAAGFLFVGYAVEHVIAYNVSNDRPYLSFPRR